MSVFFDIFSLLYRHLEDFKDFSIYIVLFNNFWENLREILKLVDKELISSTLDNCLNERRFEQK